MIACGEGGGPGECLRGRGDDEGRKAEGECLISLGRRKSGCTEGERDYEIEEDLEDGNYSDALYHGIRKGSET